jgi:hypothetical protein
VYKFLQYIAEFEPDFIFHVKGATDYENQALEKVVHHPLPQDYKDFLRLMGHDMGPAQRFFLNAWADIETIASYYQEGINTGEIEAPHNAIVIAECQYPMSHTLVMRHDTFPHQIEMYDDCDKYYSKVADSLENLLCNGVFAEYEMAKQFRHFYTNDTLANDLTVFKEATALAMDLGLERQWFSDTIRFHGKNAEAAIIIYFSDAEGLKVSIAAQSKIVFESLIHTFSKKYSMTETTYVPLG